ncbi:MAG TPA: GntR family transcriptional regulator [Acidimicrobiales bacterium]
MPTPTMSPPRRRADPARWLADVLRAQIEHGPGAHPDGVHGEGPLPSEHELCRQFGASRNVVRDALDLLRHEGLVRRVPGAGTFVTVRRAVHGLDRLRGLAETFHEGSDRVVNRVLAAEVVPASDFVAGRLEIEPGVPVVFIERLRCLDGRPLSLDASYLPADIAAPLLDGDTNGGEPVLATCDVFALIERSLGTELGMATVCIEAVAADAATAFLLEVALASPLLLVNRLARLVDGRPVDFEFVRYRGDRLSLTAHLVR